MVNRAGGPIARSNRYRCSLPGLAGFTAFRRGDRRGHRGEVCPNRPRKDSACV